ncbi:hypothetical protein XELAEV_18005804mg [Xenopus laevis]|nr:hypothetical protein XELAEV_18005804mg [Xenopus laevis]
MDDGHLGKACKKIMLNKRSISYQTTQNNTYRSSDETANSQNTRNVNNPLDLSKFTDSDDLEDIPYDYYTTNTHSNAHSSEFSYPSDSNESNLPSGPKQDGVNGALNRSGISSSISVSSESRESRQSGSNSGSKEVLAKPGKNSNELSAAKPGQNE